MVSENRAHRISKQIRDELSMIIIQEIADPRLEHVTITDVKVDRELAFATIFVSAFDQAENQEEILAGLEHAKGYLRRELASRIELRSFPQLKFRWDYTIEKAERIEQIIAQIKAEEQNLEDANQDNH